MNTGDSARSSWSLPPKGIKSFCGLKKEDCLVALDWRISRVKCEKKKCGGRAGVQFISLKEVFIEYL